MTLVNLELILGIVLEFKSYPKYLGLFEENTPFNRPNQMLGPTPWKFQISKSPNIGILCVHPEDLIFYCTNKVPKNHNQFWYFCHRGETHFLVLAQTLNYWCISISGGDSRGRVHQLLEYPILFLENNYAFVVYSEYLCHAGLW